ncbi:hypothetical protein SAMN04488061_2895 [Filomicrobium insigne]|uniref:Uncharacterized protein n=1 Tax=Filomicrobium insigne TaxID=418854 RepID=A0A1H0SH47_9HYPH|nr:hypothetical protein SAMN04488061_2895 [Filomicrobium insigne]
MDSHLEVNTPSYRLVPAYLFGRAAGQFVRTSGVSKLGLWHLKCEPATATFVSGILDLAFFHGAVQAFPRYAIRKVLALTRWADDPTLVHALSTVIGSGQVMSQHRSMHRRNAEDAKEVKTAD